MEADLVSRALIPFRPIPAAGIHGVSIKSLPGNLVKLFRGWLASRQILREFCPDVLLFTGGYVAVPMALAAKSYKKLLYVPDIEPGLALKQLSASADIIALTVDQSRHYFSANKKMRVTGYPVRHELLHWNRSQALAALNLNPDLKTLLVFGGSKGAQSINQALTAGLPRLLENYQVIHITGKSNFESIQRQSAQLNQHHLANYHLYPYLHEEMGAAMAAADLVVCRAGASTLGELPLFGLPAVLVPYPYAWRYQKVNADYLADKQAATVLKNEDLDEQLIDLILNLLQNDTRLTDMRKAMKALYQPEAANKIADLLKELSGDTSTAGGKTW